MYLAYIHGFLSGPGAVKAHKLKAYLAAHHPEVNFIAPDHPDTPREALSYLRDYFRPYAGRPLGLCGSSMGGFFATKMNIEFGFPAVLLNPCVHPHEYFRALIGPHDNPVTGRSFELVPQMIDDLQRMDCNEDYHDQDIRVYLQTGDEVLDYRKALSFYARSEIVLREGGDHPMTNDFDAIMPEVVDFLLERMAAK